MLLNSKPLISLAKALIHVQPASSPADNQRSAPSFSPAMHAPVGALITFTAPAPPPQTVPAAAYSTPSPARPYGRATGPLAPSKAPPSSGPGPRQLPSHPAQPSSQALLHDYSARGAPRGRQSPHEAQSRGPPRRQRGGGRLCRRLCWGRSHRRTSPWPPARCLACLCLARPLQLQVSIDSCAKRGCLVLARDAALLCWRLHVR